MTTYDYTAKHFTAGTSPPQFEAGDCIITSSKSYVGGAIRLGERLRFRGGTWRHWAHYNHAAGITDASGNLIEMLAGGATAGNISKYLEKDYWHIKCPMPDRAQLAVSYWQWALEVHTGYGWLAAICDGLACLTGSNIVFGTKGRLICSGLVAAGYCYAGMPGTMQWVADPSHVFPCELGHQYADPA